MAKTISGIDLKVERVRAGATQRDVARHMGVSAARVSVIERSGNSPNTAVAEDTAARYRGALGAIEMERSSGKPTVHRVELVGALGNVQEQYKVAKATARAEVRHDPSIRTIEVLITDDVPAATVIGYLDGLLAAGVSPVVLDSHGTVVNRRIG